MAAFVGALPPEHNPTAEEVSDAACPARYDGSVTLSDEDFDELCSVLARLPVIWLKDGSRTHSSKHGVPPFSRSTAAARPFQPCSAFDAPPISSAWPSSLAENSAFHSL